MYVLVHVEDFLTSESEPNSTKDMCIYIYIYIYILKLQPLSIVGPSGEFKLEW